MRSWFPHRSHKKKINKKFIKLSGYICYDIVILATITPIDTDKRNAEARKFSIIKL